MLLNSVLKKMRENKVNLFIIGSAKSGTTSLHDYLDQHPNICMSSVKEPNFFSCQDIKNDNLYYLDAPLIHRTEDYEKLFKPNEDKYLGESSVSYMYYPNAVKRIKKYNPQAKIIMLLRNPVERAFSHYLMDYSSGYINCDFGQLIRNEQVHSVAYQQVVKYGLYFEQIKRVLEEFPKENVLVLISENSLNNLKRTMVEIEEFLELNEFSDYSFNVKNSYLAAKSGFIKQVYRSPKAKLILKKLISKKLKDSLKLRFLSAKKPLMHETDRAFLLKLYEKDLILLSELIDTDLNGIWK